MIMTDVLSLQSSNMAEKFCTYIFGLQDICQEDWYILNWSYHNGCSKTEQKI